MTKPQGTEENSILHFVFSSYITYISKFYYILLTMHIFYNKVSTILWWAGKGHLI